MGTACACVNCEDNIMDRSQLQVPTLLTQAEPSATSGNDSGPMKASSSEDWKAASRPTPSPFKAKEDPVAPTSTALQKKDEQSQETDWSEPSKPVAVQRKETRPRAMSKASSGSPPSSPKHVSQSPPAKERRTKSEAMGHPGARSSTEKHGKAGQERQSQESQQQQEAIITDHLEQQARRVKELETQNLGELGKDGAWVQVHLETGWTDQSASEVKQIKDHVSGGEQKFMIQARGAMYAIDWHDPNNLTQLNMLSKTIRQLRVVQK